MSGVPMNGTPAISRARSHPVLGTGAAAGEVPPGEVWVHCASGFRASIGASLLDQAGRQVVHIDDDWDRAAELGLPVTADD